MSQTLITGGAGFIGTNLAHRLLQAGENVLIFDNLSRPGVDRNLRWLCDTHSDGLEIDISDIRDADAVRRAVVAVSRVFHFGAQVAVTTSLDEPLGDFEVNARGTLNLLEAIREQPAPPSLVFTSTNKVYGNLAGLRLQRNEARYVPLDDAVGTYGVDERCPLDFHSPYGCSKGAADQYVLDYARSYGLPAVVFRMSCIYGPHQLGTEDQGWVGHFILRALEGLPITVYGDGRQVRDILFVDDLVDALLIGQRLTATDAGQAFNIGGGPSNAVSLLDVLEHIEEATGDAPEVEFGGWRVGDQRYYVSDIRRFTRLTDWRPQVSAADGIRRLVAWLATSRPDAPRAAVSPRHPAGAR